MRIYMITKDGDDGTLNGSVLIIGHDGGNGVLAFHERLCRGNLHDDRIVWHDESDVDSLSCSAGFIYDRELVKEIRWNLIFDDGINADLYDDQSDADIVQAKSKSLADQKTRRIEEIVLNIQALEATLLEDPDEPDDDHGQTRCVVVVDRKLQELATPLRERNMIVITAAADDIDDETRSRLLPFRSLIVNDERPFIDDASSYSYGIVSVRLLSRREPGRVAKTISDAFARRTLWNKRHGFLLLLRDDGAHEYQPLVD